MAQTFTDQFCQYCRDDGVVSVERVVAPRQGHCANCGERLDLVRPVHACGTRMVLRTRGTGRLVWSCGHCNQFTYVKGAEEVKPTK